MFSDTQQGDLAKTQPPYEKGGSLKGHCRLDVEPAKGAGQKDGGLLQLSLPGGKTTRPPRPLLLSLHGLLSTTLMPLPVGGFGLCGFGFRTSLTASQAPVLGEGISEPCSRSPVRPSQAVGFQ